MLLWVVMGLLCLMVVLDWYRWWWLTMMHLLLGYRGRVASLWCRDRRDWRRYSHGSWDYQLLGVLLLGLSLLKVLYTGFNCSRVYNWSRASCHSMLLLLVSNILVLRCNNLLGIHHLGTIISRTPLSIAPTLLNNTSTVAAICIAWA